MEDNGSTWNLSTVNRQGGLSSTFGQKTKEDETRRKKSVSQSTVRWKKNELDGNVFIRVGEGFY